MRLRKENRLLKSWKGAGFREDVSTGWGVGGERQVRKSERMGFRCDLFENGQGQVPSICPGVMGPTKEMGRFYGLHFIGGPTWPGRLPTVIAEIFEVGGWDLWREGLVVVDRAKDRAKVSAISLPGYPTWLAIQQNFIVYCRVNR